MKVIFNQAIAGADFYYTSGQVVELPSAAAAEFLNAGFCEVVEEKKAENVSKQNSGLYIIAGLTHYIHVTEGTFTKLSLARDSFGKTGKPSKTSITN